PPSITFRLSVVPSFRLLHLPLPNPRAPHSRQSLPNVVPLGPARVVDPERGLAAGEGNLAHRDPDAVRALDVDLAGVGEDAAVGGRTDRRKDGRWEDATFRLLHSRGHDSSPRFEERRPRDDGGTARAPYAGVNRVRFQGCVSTTAPAVVPLAVIRV